MLADGIGTIAHLPLMGKVIEPQQGIDTEIDGFILSKTVNNLYSLAEIAYLEEVVRINNVVITLGEQILTVLSRGKGIKARGVFG